MDYKIVVKTKQKAKTRNEALKLIADHAYEQKIVLKKDITNLYKAFVEREELSTTAFQDGFAIPHARIESIKEACIIVMKFSSLVDWPCLNENEKGVKCAIALLVPSSKASDIHIDLLSNVARLLLEDEFRQNLLSNKTELQIKKYLEEKIKDKSDNNKVEANNISKTENNNNSQQIKIVGVSACATGIAHTYMAKDSLENAGKELNYIVKIETQGQKGVENRLSQDEIDEADAVIFATDVYVEEDRFVDKKILKVKTNDAINHPKDVIQSALNLSSDNVVKEKSNKTHSMPGNKEFKSSLAKTFMGHLLSGVSRMIPFVVFSGILWAIFNSILQINPSLEKNNLFLIAKSISEIGFTVFIAFMGGFIAESIAGRAGLAPGFICTFAAANSSYTFWWNINGLEGIPQIDFFFKNAKDLGINNVGLSLFAAILMGFAAGYFVKWVNGFKYHKLIAPLIAIVFIPIVCTSLIIFPFTFLLSGPLGFLMNGLVYGISEGGKIPFLNFFIGCLLGAMIGFDMGGPINKIAGTTATALITVDPRLMGSVAAAIPIAPLGCGLATLIARNLFSEKERAEGISALGLGFFGISEGAIPFAINRPKKVLIANLVGSSIAGGLSFLFYVGGYVGMWGGPITALVLGVKAPVDELAKLNTVIPNVFGGNGLNGLSFLSILWFFLSIIAGTIIHSFLLIFMIMLDSNDKTSNKFINKFRDFRNRNKQEENINSNK